MRKGEIKLGCLGCRKGVAVLGSLKGIEPIVSLLGTARQGHVAAVPTHSTITGL